MRKHTACGAWLAHGHASRNVASLVAGHHELARPRLDLRLEGAELVGRLLLLERLEEVGELLARLLLRLLGDEEAARGEVRLQPLQMKGEESTVAIAPVAAIVEKLLTT